MLGAIAVIGFNVWRRYGYAALIAGCRLAVPVLLASTRLAEIDADEASAEGRLDAWYEGIQLLLQYPLFRRGFLELLRSQPPHRPQFPRSCDGGAGPGRLPHLAGVCRLLRIHALPPSFAPGTSPSAVNQRWFSPEIAASRALYAGSLGFAIGAFLPEPILQVHAISHVRTRRRPIYWCHGRGWRTLVIQDQSARPSSGRRWPSPASSCSGLASRYFCEEGTVYPELFRHVLFPAYETLTRSGTHRFLAEYRRNQWLDAESIARIQLDKLNTLARILLAARFHISKSAGARRASRRARSGRCASSKTFQF